MQATEQEALLFGTVPYALMSGAMIVDGRLALHDGEGTGWYLPCGLMDTPQRTAPRSVLAGPRESDWTWDGWKLLALACGVFSWALLGLAVVGVGAVVLWLARGG